jgi:signal recognition particle GTPase
MKSTEMLNQIKTLLNIEVKLEETKLENGTIVSAESFEKGKEIFIVTDDEKVAMPVGEYLLEDGRLVVVEEEGVIGDVREVSDEVPAKETEEGEEITEDLAEEEEKKEEEMADVADWEGMEKRIQNLEDAIADLKADKESKMQEEEMSNEVQAPLKSRTVKEEFSEEIPEEVKTELSEAAAKPIKHNPESKSKTINKVEFGKGKFTSTLDRVLNKLNK